LKHVGAGEMLAFSAADFEDFKEPRPDLPSDMEPDMLAILRFLTSIHWPFRLHATYGESIHRELALFEQLEQEKPGSISSLRWFIDHAETISVADIHRIKALNGSIAIQHRMAFQGEYFTQRYGAQAALTAPPLQQMIQAGVHVGAGTDGTRVATYNPWVSLYWLVTGRTVGGLQLYGPTNIVSRMAALRLWTEANTWLSNDDTTAGSLVRGRKADLAVLDKDYFTVPEEEITSIESLLTMVNGRVVYINPSAQNSIKVPEESLHANYQRDIPAAVPSWSPVNYFGGYQIKGSTAWNHQGHEPAIRGTTDTASIKQHLHSGGNPQHRSATNTAPINPEEFFMHGHDC